MRRLFLIAAFCGLFPLALGQTTYRITDLGVLPGANSSGARAINERGHVVGTSGRRAFIWDPKRGMRDIGVPQGKTNPEPVAINNSDQVAVNFGSGRYSAAYWSEKTGFIDIGQAYEGVDMFLSGINDAGLLVGYGGSLAYTWTIRNGIRRLPAPPPSDTDFSGARAVNELGHVTGYIGTSKYILATIWGPSGLPRFLGFLPGSTQSAGQGINNRGDVVGTCDGPFGLEQKRAFIWTQEQGMFELTMDGKNYAVAVDINDSREVIGRAAVIEDNGHSYDPELFVWSPAQGMRRFKDLIDPSTPGWTFDRLTDINNHGQIVGGGYKDGQYRAFLATPVP